MSALSAPSPAYLLHAAAGVRGARERRYGDGSLRFTVEQNIVFPNIPEGRLGEMQQEAIFKVHQIEAPPLSRGLVSCTGAQFCGIALIETKNRSPPPPPTPPTNPPPPPLTIRMNAVRTEWMGNKQEI